MVKISNKAEDVVQKTRKYGLNHNIPAAHFSRFWGDIEPPARISESRIFHDFSIGSFSYISGGFFYHTHIGRYCSLSNGLHIGQGNHPTDWLSTHPFQYQNLKFDVGDGYNEREEYIRDAATADNSKVQKPTKTKIGNDVWVSHGVFVKNGVSIGDGAILGARAVVTKDVPPYAIVVGNPARVVKLRFPEETIQRLLELRWWKYAPWQIRDVDFSSIDKAMDDLERKISSGMAPYTPETIVITRAANK
ncbi:CatB-related O-acetyltransferase [Alloyangia pacifica]|uniref:CatB-related O-acetyltransferase n=1 Tax=Alloyangia pacifica TaxID=311180 RepID=UPI001CD6322C|nr:CatB-related O-acetyltransferase [Alloyangia pacifica]MCA0998664.1 CatB-related O-acetyltransferase [Alloyangia pacifica]